MNNIAKIKWFSLLFFVLAIVFIVFLLKNGGNFAATWTELTSFFK